jgi:hypothetical protein
MMGVDTPIPPILMNARRPEGRPAAGFRTVNEIWEIEPSCPAVPRRGPEAGNPRDLHILLPIFMV